MSKPVIWLLRGYRKYNQVGGENGAGRFDTLSELDSGIDLMEGWKGKYAKCEGRPEM